MAEGLSVKLPLRVDQVDGAYALNKSLEDMAEQNLKMVILTNPGERVMIPEFGAGIRQFLFEPATPATADQIRSRVQAQVKTYLPYINILELSVFASENNAASLSLIIKYSIPAANIVKEFSMSV